MSGGFAAFKLHRHAMGCAFEVICSGRPHSYLESAAHQAFDAAIRVEEQLSVFKPNSDISRINSEAAFEAVRVDPLLFRLLERAFIISEITDWAFDITAGRLTRLWGFRDGHMNKPEQEEIDNALKLIGKGRIVLDHYERTVAFDRPGVEIDLGAYGKGCAVDCAIETLIEADIPRAMVHSGTSSVAVIGEWAVGIRDPRTGERFTEVTLCDESMSTSGSYEQVFHHEGVGYGHVLDPQTGWPTQGVLSASIICESAAVSDALSTAALVLGETRFERVSAQLPDIRTVFISDIYDVPDNLTGRKT